MKNQLSEEQTKEILEALDKALEKGPWSESNFLKVIGKNLQSIRDDFAEHLGQEMDAEAASHLAERAALRSGQKLVYIALYSADGSKLYSWERILHNLPKQMISRPVYAEEKDIEEILRTKENKINEAYVSIYINESDIRDIPADKIPVDKLGKSLLTLKDKCIKTDNIHRFVHQSGTYKFKSGRLVKVTDTSQ